MLKKSQSANKMRIIKTFVFKLSLSVLKQVNSMAWFVSLLITPSKIYDTEICEILAIAESAAIG